MNIKLLNKKDLNDFIHSKEYELLDNIPISRHRALSHINNPRLAEDDILLLIAYIDNKMVGYLGALPDKIYYKNKLERMAWLSCLWIDENYRGKKIAFNLVQAALKEWQNKILITEYTKPAKYLYEKTNQFNILTKKIGTRLYVRFELHKILANKNKLFKKTSFLIKFADEIANLFLDLRFIFYSKILANLKIEIIDSIDSDLKEFIDKHSNHKLFKRSAEELNWILKYPWVLPYSEKSNNQNYYFSDFDTSFQFFPIKVFDKNNKLIAFLFFAKRNDSLKLQFSYTDSKYEEIKEVINNLIIKWKIKTFTCFDDKLSDLLIKGSTPSIYKKRVRRNYMISNYFEKENFIKNFEIQTGDADCVFT